MHSLMKVIFEKEVPGLGVKIKQARKADDRDLTTICAEVGMTTANWYKIESEKQSIPLDTLRKIESVLGVNFEVEF